MNLENYHKWCKDNRLPVLVRPAGIRVIGNRTYDVDGFLYVNCEPVGRYLSVCRYGGLDITLRRENIDNANRFEALQWKALLYCRTLYERQTVVVEKLFNYLKHTGAMITVMYDDRLCELRLIEDKVYGRRADGGPTLGYSSLEPLDKLSKIPKDSPACRLAAKWFLLRDRINHYNDVAGNLAHCLHQILRSMHPDVWGRRPRSFNRPCFFQINGRLYPISSGGVFSQDREYWPDPYNAFPVQEL